jgi:hypothetical protein
VETNTANAATVEHVPEIDQCGRHGEEVARAALSREADDRGLRAPAYIRTDIH